MRRFLITSALCVVALAASSVAAWQAQMAPPPPPAKQMAPAAMSLTSSTQWYYEGVKSWITASADQMKEADYTFKPATMPAPDGKDIRTFGQIIGHVAWANNMFCGIASGTKGSAEEYEKTKTMKADLQKALADSFAFCDKAWAATNDTNAKTATDLPEGMGKSTRLATLALNTSHDAEHYGNIVTYLRAKGMVPPSSQPRK
jgi:uncharacterized damage-inducible protein DinB